MTLYRTIVADPPWDYGADHARWPTAPREGIKRPPIPYAPMSLPEIRALPVDALAAWDARCFLWTTNRFLPDSFGVLAAWGFTYRQTLVWHKLGASPFGGSVAPNGAEFLLVATRGTPETLERAKSSVIASGKLALLSGHNAVDVRKDVTGWLRRGLVIERSTVGEVKAHPRFLADCKCEEAV